MGAIKLFLGGLGAWGYIAAAGLAALLAVSATHWIDAKAYGLEISNIRNADLTAQNNAVTASLAKLNGFIANMNTADANYQLDLTRIGSTFASLQKELQNALAQKPLPVDCKPDANRLRILQASISAANAKPASPAR